MDTSPLPRYDYLFSELRDGEAITDPLETFQRWVEEAIAADIPEPTAVVLATVDADGSPDARVLLLRGIDDRGLRFFTNYRSAKAQQLEGRPVASVVAHWQPLERQVRVRGGIERLPDQESDDYFVSRPRDSQISAWASRQSAPIHDRASLEAQVAAMDERFRGRTVPRPDHWGGYLLRPDTIEFWQGRRSRLHDRLRYRRLDGGWTVERIQP